MRQGAGFLVRAADESDAGRLAQIYQAARAGLFRESEVEADGVAEFRRQTEGELILVVCDPAGLVLGWMSVWLPESFIHHLYVDPVFHRRGAGRFLLASLADRVAPPYTLKCVRSNRNAMAFYDRLGWAEIGSGNSVDGDYALLEWRRMEVPA